MDENKFEELCTILNDIRAGIDAIGIKLCTHEDIYDQTKKQRFDKYEIND